MAQSEHTPRFAVLEEALIILFCQLDDIYYQLNPRGGHYASLKQLSDSEILTLTLFQQLRACANRLAAFHICRSAARSNRLLIAH